MPSTQKKIRDLERAMKRKARMAAESAANGDQEVSPKIDSEDDAHVGSAAFSNPSARAEAAKAREAIGLQQTISQLKDTLKVTTNYRQSFC